MKLGLVLLLLLWPQLSTWAQEPEGLDEVRELLQLSDAEQQYSQLLSVMTRSIQASFSAGLAETLQQRPVQSPQRQKAKEILDRNFSQFISSFQAEMKRIMPWEKLVRDVYAPVYLRHFSRRELQDVVTFFRSPTGRKFARSHSQLVQDATLAIKHQYGKQLQQQAERLTQKTLTQIGRELDAINQKP